MSAWMLRSRRASSDRHLRSLPRDARVYGIKLDQDRAPIEASLAKAAPTLVVVQVTLE